MLFSAQRSGFARGQRVRSDVLYQAPFDFFGDDIRAVDRFFSIRPEIGHIPGKQNEWADEWSRPEKAATDPSARGWNFVRRFVVNIKYIIEVSFPFFYPTGHIHDQPADRPRFRFVRPVAQEVGVFGTARPSKIIVIGIIPFWATR